MSNASSVRRGRYRQAARDAAFLLRLWPILLLAFLVVVPLIALGTGTAVLGVGVPVLVLGLSVSSRFAEIGRRAAADVDSSEYVPGHYRRPGADARSRLERDIHDGPQQRLVRLGMDLARAKRQASRDPRAAETILDGAIAQTRETLDELRSLSRGIAPPVLVDRGLAAALAEVAARSGVPVAVDADVPRLSEHVEQAAYFVASEALANLNKHSGARAAELGAAVRRRVKAVLTLLSS